MHDDDDIERSESGAPIYRHEARRRGIEPAFGDDKSIDAITSHIQQYVGNPEHVLHEIVSDLIHVDVHVVEPTRKRDYYTLITSGMSDRPMAAPEGHEDK